MKKILSLLLSFCLLPVSGVYAEDLKARYDNLSVERTKIKTLINAVEAKGMSPEYEKVNYAVLNKFIDYGLEDIENSNVSRAEYIADKLEVIAEEAVNKLTAYKDGEDTPAAVSRYVTSDAEISGYSVKAMTENSADKSREVKPVIWTGFLGAVNDIPMMKDLGANLIQTEIPMYNIVVDPDMHPAKGFSRLNIGMEADIGIAENMGIDASKAFHIKNSSLYTPGCYVQLTQSVPVEANTMYTISVKAKGTAEGSEPPLIYPNGFSETALWAEPGEDGEYLESMVSFRTGENQHSAAFMILSRASHDVYIDDLSMYASDGINVLQNGGFEEELPVYSFGGTRYAIDTTPVGMFCHYLEEAEEYDVKIDILLSPHYFPVFLSDESDMGHNKSGIDSAGYNIYNPLSKKVISDYIKNVVPLIKDYKSLNSICLTNEPAYSTRADSRELPGFQEFLSGKYGSVEEWQEVNQNYGGIESFSDIQFPSNNVWVHQPLDMLYTDWQEYNDEKFAGWHKEFADIVHEIAPGIPVHSKILNYLREDDSDNGYGIYNRAMLDIGVDAEMFDEFSDLHGNDAHSYLRGDWGSFESELMWYDFLAAISEKPIFNSEDHIISDNNTDYSPYHAVHYRANMWEGAIRGRTQQTSWVYSRDDSNEATANSLLNRPDVLLAAGHTNLDMNRLSEEITAFQNEEAEIALYFSKITRNNNPAHLGELFNAYKKAIATGKKTAVITDKQVLNGGLNKYKIIIMPEVTCVGEEGQEQILNYLNAGGRIISVGGFLTKTDEYLDNTTEVREEIEKLAEDTTSELLDETLLKTLDSLEPDRIRIVDTESGEELTNADWRHVVYQGRDLISVCSLADYDAEPTEIEIYKGNEKMMIEEDMLNLCSEDLNTLTPFVPKLLYVREEVNETDYKINIVSQSGSSLSPGFFSVTAEAVNPETAQNICFKIELVNKENGQVEESAEFLKYTGTGGKIGLSAGFNIPKNVSEYYIMLSVENAEEIESIHKVYIE